MSTHDAETSATPQRWRLVLGRYAQNRLPLDGDGDSGEEARIDAALDYLYGREYAGRGGRPDGGGGSGAGEGADQRGSLEQSQPHGIDDSDLSHETLLRWLGEVRELFPQQAVEVVERHALDRYELTGLLTDPQTLDKLEPSESLLRTLVALKGHLSGPALPIARRIIAAVVDQLRRRMEADIRPALSGRLNQQRHSPLAIAANLDARDTIRRNLKNWDVERKQLVLKEVRFFDRNTRRFPWEIVICVDQSGSMVDSVIHSAVMAGILASLPGFRVKLVVFDTAVVDLTDQVDDPVEVLMSVQLGGGTNIAKALRYCAGIIDNPSRSVLVLVTDFCEGGPPSELVRATRDLAESRVKLIGLAALEITSKPQYDRVMAGQLADVGMKIAALTPSQLAEWLIEVTS